jgi:hypothetical protein
MLWGMWGQPPPAVRRAQPGDGAREPSPPRRASLPRGSRHRDHDQRDPPAQFKSPRTAQRFPHHVRRPKDCGVAHSIQASQHPRKKSHRVRDSPPLVSSHGSQSCKWLCRDSRPRLSVERSSTKRRGHDSPGCARQTAEGGCLHIFSSAAASRTRQSPSRSAR